MILAFDTSTAACSAALFDRGGECIDRRDEVIGRGHAERLVPMIADMLGKRRPERILVGVGPGSFTGLRVAIAAAQGLAIGWDCGISGMSSLALLAVGQDRNEPVGAAMDGGHGELFVQQFEGASGEPLSDLLSLSPAEAALRIEADLVIGPGAQALVEARGRGNAIAAWPSAAHALRLEGTSGSLAVRPVYARGPDARARKVA